MLVGEAGGNLAHQDEGHGGEDGGWVEAAGEADGKDERDPMVGQGRTLRSDPAMPPWIAVRESR